MTAAFKLDVDADEESDFCAGGGDIFSSPSDHPSSESSPLSFGFVSLTYSRLNKFVVLVVDQLCLF